MESVDWTACSLQYTIKSTNYAVNSFQLLLLCCNAQLYGQRRQGGCGVCRRISIRTEAPSTSKRFNSPLTQNNYVLKNIIVITKVKMQHFPIDLQARLKKKNIESVIMIIPCWTLFFKL